MKLTTEILKRLIKEELEIIKENQKEHELSEEEADLLFANALSAMGPDYDEWIHEMTGLNGFDNQNWPSGLWEKQPKVPARIVVPALAKILAAEDVGGFDEDVQKDFINKAKQYISNTFYDGRGAGF